MYMIDFIYTYITDGIIIIENIRNPHAWSLPLNRLAFSAPILVCGRYSAWIVGAKKFPKKGYNLKPMYILAINRAWVQQQLAEAEGLVESS